MNKLIFLFITSMVFIISAAQDNEFKTIFNREDDKTINVSGFGGPMMAFTGIAGEYAHMMGGGGGVIVNNVFFGGYGLGLTTQNYYRNQNQIQQDSSYLGFGHGGFWVGCNIAPKKAVHLSVSTMLGWGNIAEIEKIYEDPIRDHPVFVVTPLVEVELNFSKFFKMGVGSSLSIVQELRGDSGYTMKDFANPSVFLSFKFGWFE